MENKLNQLTQKLYNEGLSKGRAEANTLVAEAESKAKKIVSDARQEAKRIIQKAEQEAANLKKNTETEVVLACRKSIEQLREQIRHAIVEKSVVRATAEAVLDASFVKDMLLAVAGNWQGAASERIGLEALLPADRKEQLDAAFGSSAHALLEKGIELRYADGVKSGFRIGPKDGGYYISFSDEDFNVLLGEYLRPKVAEMLHQKT